MSNQITFISGSTLDFLTKCAHLLPMKNTYSFLLITALINIMALAIFANAPAQAQNVTETEAQRLQTTFQNILNARKAEISSETERPRELILNGDVTVEPTDTYYAITLPQITISYPDGDRVEIGLISLNAIPHEKPDRFKMTMALPTPILGFDSSGQEVMRIAINAQKTAGIWHEKLENFIKLDAVYNDIQITGGGANATIPEVRVRYDLEETENGRWSGPTYMEATGINISEPDGKSISLEKIALSLLLDQFATEAFSLPTQETPPTLTLTDGADFKISLHGLNARKTDKDGTNKSLSLKQAHFNFSYDDALNDSMDAHISFGFNDLKEDNIPQEIVALFPQSAQLKLTHHNIPISAINEVISNSAGNDPKIIGLGLLLKIPAIMAQAGSYLQLYETSIKNDNYHLTLDTTLRADITATNSATATGQLRFAGLDKVLSLAQVEGRNLASSEYAAPMRTLARFLERLKPMGRVETDTENGFTHVFDLEMNKAGQILINNQNAATLFNEPSEPEMLIQPEPQETDL